MSAIFRVLLSFILVNGCVSCATSSSKSDRPPTTTYASVEATSRSAPSSFGNYHDGESHEDLLPTYSKIADEKAEKYTASAIAAGATVLAVGKVGMDVAGAGARKVLKAIGPIDLTARGPSSENSERNQNNSPKRIPCSACSGYGYHSAEAKIFGFWEKGPKCAVCDGTGKVWVR